MGLKILNGISKSQQPATIHLLKIELKQSTELMNRSQGTTCLGAVQINQREGLITRPFLLLANITYPLIERKVMIYETND